MKIWRGHGSPFTFLFLFIVILFDSTHSGLFFSFDDSVANLSKEEIIELREKVRDMFYHGYHNYMKFAFPHDELKPISKTYTDSFVELGIIGVRI